MPLQWNVSAEKFLHRGLDQPVLFVHAADGTPGAGIAWEGLTGVTESPEGGEPEKLWANNVPYAEIVSKQTLNITLEALHYPEEFELCIGNSELYPGLYLGQQAQRRFSICYRTQIYGANSSAVVGHKYHFVFNLHATPSEMGHVTINESAENAEMSWEASSLEVNVSEDGYNNLSKLTVDSRFVEAAALTTITNTIYGDPSVPTSTSAYMSPDQIIAAVAAEQP